MVIYSRAMTQAVIRQPLTADARFASGSVHEAFTVKKVELGQVFLRVLYFPSVRIIPPWLSILVFNLGDGQYAPWWPQFRDVVLSHQYE
jgi:hypothetical protein